SSTWLGWRSYYIEDCASHTQAFQSQVASLVCEGVFAKFPRPQSGPARVRGDVASRILVAVLEILARRARRGALGRSLARGDRARSRAPHHPAIRRARRPGSAGTGDRPFALRCYTALRLGFSALAVRW